MKKLMIIALALVMGVCVQAASLDWASCGFYNDGSADEDWFTGGQAYLILVTDKTTFSVANDLSITGGSIVDSIAYDGGAAANSVDGAKFGAEEGTTYYFAVLATDKGDGIAVPTTGLYGVDNNNGSFYDITWNKDTGGAFYNEESGASVSLSVAGGSVDPIGPGPGGIPEPTSGLLLLVGGALLALRRKQK